MWSRFFGLLRRHAKQSARARHLRRGYGRQLRIEALEDRCVLSSTADIVFLFDESESTATVQLDWLADMVVDLDASLLPAGIVDRRYGMVGFADGFPTFGHTHLVDPNDTDQNGDTFFGTASQLADAAIAIDTAGGDGEDGWDAIEHGIAEYDFRAGAAVIFVLTGLLQNVKSTPIGR